MRKLLENLDIEVIHKNSRGWLVASCPFAEFLHDSGTDRNPSFMVKVNPTGYSGFNCYTCHQKGNLSRFLRRLGYFREEDYGFLAMQALKDETPEKFEAWDDLRGCFEDEDEGLDPLDAQLYLRMYPLAWEDPTARAYLIRRGTSEEASSLLDLRYDPEKRRVLFPVYDGARTLYGFTGRSTMPNPKIKVKDYAGLKKERCLLGEHLVDDAKPLLLVEGLFALAHMVTIGVREFANPVASMGSFLSETQRDILASYMRPVYLLYDNDEAGDLGLFGELDEPGAIAKLRGHVPAFVCLYPEGVNDPDRLSLEQVREGIEDAYLPD